MSQGSLRLYGQNGFLQVVVVPDEGNDGNNSDKFWVTIDTSEAGQKMLTTDGREVSKVSFCIVGNFEINDFLNCIGGDHE